MKEYDILLRGAEALAMKIDKKPDVAVVLGSGLGEMAQASPIRVDYSLIPGMPRSTVPGHDGAFCMDEVQGKSVLFMSGRAHLYEGYSPAEAVRGVRLMRLAGAEKLILTNAAGAINADFDVGYPVMISGQISSFVPSPLVGENPGALGVRFPDMTEVYSARIRDIARSAFEKRSVKYREGVYLQVTGPQYETPEEINAYRALGADMVGMSTAIEAIAARHAGMEVAGVSFITNRAAGLGGGKLSHEEVRESAERGGELFRSIVRALIAAV